MLSNASSTSHLAGPFVVGRPPIGTSLESYDPLYRRANPSVAFFARKRFLAADQSGQTGVIIARFTD
jgi:hypothetical protein